MSAPLRPTLRARLLDRGGDRHPVHYDREAANEIAARAAAGEWDPLPLAGVLLRIDTTNGFPADVPTRSPRPGRRRREALLEARSGDTRGRVIALIGNLSRDLLPEQPPRVGGGPYHGARALQRLRVPARILTRCAPADRDACCRRSSGSARPFASSRARRPRPSRSRIAANSREMRIEALGDTWLPTDLPELPPLRWAHVAPLARHEFPAETIAALARRCRVSFDGQGLVRVPRGRTATLDTDYDPASCSGTCGRSSSPRRRPRSSAMCPHSVFAR